MSQVVKGINIARACAEVILEHAPEGDRKAIDALKSTIVKFCAFEGMAPDDLAIATITATIGKTIDLSNIISLNITEQQEKGGHA